MSKSIHETYRDLKGKSRKEIDQMLYKPDSILQRLAKKRALKKAEKLRRKALRNKNSK